MRNCKAGTTPSLDTTIKSLLMGPGCWFVSRAPGVACVQRKGKS